LLSTRTGITIAVEDIASAAPIVAAEAGGSPSVQATAPSARVVRTTCPSPSPNTSLRMSRSRSNDSSSPIVKRSATTPKAASLSIDSTLIANALSQGAFLPIAPRP
jgi:hypothetical protein